MTAAQDNSSAPDCPGCRRRDREIAELRERMAALEDRNKRLEERLEAALRAGKRQAAPFSKGPPKADPKRPGRKSGENYGTHARRSIPPRIDERHEAPLPTQCPNCSGRAFRNRHVVQQYQVEIPREPIYRQFDVHVGECTCCGKHVQGRHPLQTSDALGAAASQIGPEAQALAVHLNKEAGLSWGKVARFFKMMYGMELSRGGACRIMLRAAQRCEGSYQAIVRRVRQSPQAVSDETGWRIAAKLGWLHVAAGVDAVAYLIARERGFEASARLIGQDYGGVLVHDGWAPYERFFKALHQTCLAHLLRRCREMLEVARGGAVLFPRKVKGLLQEALEVRDRREAGTITAAGAARKAEELERRMEKLAGPWKQNAANERLAKHLWKNGLHLFTFLRHEGIDATNWRAEQAIRPAVVNRKVWGGSRTERGAEAQSILMSVLRTGALLGRDTMEFISQVLCAVPGRRPVLAWDTG